MHLFGEQSIPISQPPIANSAFVRLDAMITRKAQRLVPGDLDLMRIELVLVLLHEVEGRLRTVYRTTGRNIDGEMLCLFLHELQQLGIVCSHVQKLSDQADALRQIRLHVLVVQPQDVCVFAARVPRNCTANTQTNTVSERLERHPSLTHMLHLRRVGQRHVRYLLYHHPLNKLVHIYFAFLEHPVLKKEVIGYSRVLRISAKQSTVRTNQQQDTDLPDHDDVLAESLNGHVIKAMRPEETGRLEWLGRLQFAFVLILVIELDEWDDEIDFVEVHVPSGAKSVHNLLHPSRS